jgi:hypothetical protein
MIVKRKKQEQQERASLSEHIPNKKKPATQDHWHGNVLIQVIL